LHGEVRQIRRLNQSGWLKHSRKGSGQHHADELAGSAVGPAALREIESINCIGVHRYRSEQDSHRGERESAEKGCAHLLYSVSVFTRVSAVAGQFPSRQQVFSRTVAPVETQWW
jgi:hypothetical protein